jgi:hypothetical protein
MKGHQKDMCVKDTRLRAHSVITILSLISNIFGEGLVRSVPLKTHLPHNECCGYSSINLLR